MAKFSQTFLQGLLQPSYQQGLFEAARGVGMTPGIMRMQKQQQEEKARKDKGILSGNMAIQQAAQAGNLTDEMLRSYATNMQGLGVPNEDIIKTVSNLRQVNQAASKENKAKSFVESLGSDYVDLYEAGISISDIRAQHIKDKGQQAIEKIVQSSGLDIDPTLAAQMDAKEIYNLLEEQKTDQGNREWAAWINKNPKITDSNRAEAVKAAAKAFGADAPQKVADLEAKQLANEANRKGLNVVKATVTLNSAAAFVPVFGTEQQTKLQTVNLAVDSQGNFTEESKKWLEEHAQHAFVPSTNKSWTTDKPQSSTITQVDSGQDVKGTTLSQLAPSLVTGLTNTQFKE